PMMFRTTPMPFTLSVCPATSGAATVKTTGDSSSTTFMKVSQACLSSPSVFDASLVALSASATWAFCHSQMFSAFPVLMNPIANSVGSMATKAMSGRKPCRVGGHVRRLGDLHLQADVFELRLDYLGELGLRRVH